jgi:hypothetical protein
MVALSGLTPITWKDQQTASDESAHAQSPYVRVRVRARGSPGVSDCSPASRGGSIAGRSTTRTAGIIAVEVVTRRTWRSEAARRRIASADRCASGDQIACRTAGAGGGRLTTAS